jgi:large subunit ribosomal protein L4
VSSAKNILVVLSAEDVSGWKSLRNVPEVHLITSGQLNTYDVLVSDDVVFTRAALDEFVANASRGISVKVAVAVDVDDAPSGRHAARDEAITLTKTPAAADSAADDSTEEDAK